MANSSSWPSWLATSASRSSGKSISRLVRPPWSHWRAVLTLRLAGAHRLDAGRVLGTWAGRPGEDGRTAPMSRRVRVASRPAVRVHLVGMGPILPEAQGRHCPALATRLLVVIACGRGGCLVKIVRSDERRPRFARGRG
jgi:hypothetical protein